MAFHVYVDGPIERTADGMQRLAEAMCQRYGLRPSDIVSRLSRGRFRVKANLDRPTADVYARDLEKIGARVVVEEARDSQPIPSHRSDAVSLPPTIARETRSAAESNGPPTRPTPPPGSRVIVAKPPGRPYAISTPPTGTPIQPAGSRSAATPPAGVPARTTTPGSYGPISSARATTPPRGQPGRPTTPSNGAPVRTTTPPAGTRTATPPAGTRTATIAGNGAARPTTPPTGQQQFSSGLAAAFSDQVPVQNFGALDASSLSLASVDGLDSGAPLSVAAHQAASPEPSAFAPPVRPTPAPEKDQKEKDKKDRPKDVPLDLFAPPDIGEQALVVELATDELEHQARKRASTPIPVASLPAPARPSSPMLQRKSQPSIGQPQSLPQPITVARAIASPRVRLAAGVVLAIVLGFVPAHVVAAVRERAAFKSIDAAVEQTQAAATTPDSYARLDAFRADQLDRKRGEQRAIALVSLLIWGVVAGGLGYVWFRRIPWDRLARG